MNIKQKIPMHMHIQVRLVHLVITSLDVLLSVHALFLAEQETIILDDVQR